MHEPQIAGQTGPQRRLRAIARRKEGRSGERREDVKFAIQLKHLYVLAGFDIFSFLYPLLNRISMFLALYKVHTHTRTYTHTHVHKNTHIYIYDQGKEDLERHSYCVLTMFDESSRTNGDAVVWMPSFKVS